MAVPANFDVTGQPINDINNPSPAASGAGGASTGGLPPGSSGTNQFTGFAQQQNYDPAMLDQTIWSNPWAILPDVFKGINTSGPGYQAMRNLGADPLTLYNIMMGSQNNDLYGTKGGTGTGDYTNWLASLMASLGQGGAQGGGRQFSGAELLDNIFNAKKGSTLASILGTGDLSTQMRTIFNMAKEGSNVGMNPLAARGYQGTLQNAGDTALNQMLHQPVGAGVNNQSLMETLRQIAPSLVP